MTEEYVKIYCDRCGKEALVRKAHFSDCIAGCCISDSGRWSLKDICIAAVSIKEVHNDY